MNYMPRKVKQGGAVPGSGLTAVNLGDPLRRQLERKRQRKHMVDRLWSKSLPASTGCGGLRDPLSQKADSQGATPCFANCSHPAVCKTVADPGANFMHPGHAERPVSPTLQERGWIV